MRCPALHEIIYSFVSRVTHVLREMTNQTIKITYFTFLCEKQVNDKIKTLEQMKLAQIESKDAENENNSVA